MCQFSGKCSKTSNIWGAVIDHCMVNKLLLKATLGTTSSAEVSPIKKLIK